MPIKILYILRNSKIIITNQYMNSRFKIKENFENSIIKIVLSSKIIYIETNFIIYNL
jgi:hypothetical protein